MDQPNLIRFEDCTGKTVATATVADFRTVLLRFTDGTYAALKPCDLCDDCEGDVGMRNVTPTARELFLAGVLTREQCDAELAKQAAHAKGMKEWRDRAEYKRLKALFEGENQPQPKDAP